MPRAASPRLQARPCRPSSSAARSATSPTRAATSCGRARVPTHPGYAFSVHVAAPVDPRTDVNWRTKPTQIQWFARHRTSTATADAVATVRRRRRRQPARRRWSAFSDQFVSARRSARYTATHDYLATFPVGCIPGAPAVPLVGDLPLRQRASAERRRPRCRVRAGAHTSARSATGCSAPTRCLRLRILVRGAPSVALGGRRDHRPSSTGRATGRRARRATSSNRGTAGTLRIRAPSLADGERITTISATPTGSGYRLFSNRGRVFPFGDGAPYGSLAALRLNGAIVASARHRPLGYYMVGTDGGVFAFGDAEFHGSMGGNS